MKTFQKLGALVAVALALTVAAPSASRANIVMIGPSRSSPIDIAALCSSGCNIGTLSFMPTPDEIVLVFGSDFNNFPNQNPTTIQNGAAKQKFGSLTHG